MLPFAFEPLSDENDADDEDGEQLNNPLNYFKAWIGTMSGSPSRAFRHTATLVALWITTVICEKIHLLGADSAKLRKQLDALTKNKGRVSSKMGGLKQDLAEIQNKRSVLEDYMNEFYNGCVGSHQKREYCYCLVWGLSNPWTSVSLSTAIATLTRTSAATRCASSRSGSASSRTRSWSRRTFATLGGLCQTR